MPNVEMLKHFAKFIAFLLGLLVNIAVQRLLAPRSVFSTLAITSLLTAAAAWSTPVWSLVIEAMVSTRLQDPPISSAHAGTLFFGFTFVFAWLSHKATQTKVPESLVDTKLIGPPISVATSQVFCYCGTVLTLSEAEVVVTSENTELSLGDLLGISMSGRMRRAAAEFHLDGSLKEDHLLNSVNDWKSAQNTKGPYALGTCVINPPFNATRQDVKAIVHAVAIRKCADGSRQVDAAALSEIVKFALNFCVENNHRSIFIPIFGIGSGGLSVRTTAPLTINPLVEHLSKCDRKLLVYLGTYRLSDAAIVGKQLLEASVDIR